MRLTIFISLITFLLVSCAEKSNRELSEPPPANTMTSPQITDERYREERSGRGENENGVPFSFHTFRGPSGETVLTRFEAYDSIVDGRSRFDHVVKSSGEIMDDGPLVDENGSTVGKRVVTKRRTAPSEFKLILFLSPSGKLYIAEASSTETLLDFEKQFARRILHASPREVLK